MSELRTRRTDEELAEAVRSWDARAVEMEDQAALIANGGDASLHERFAEAYRRTSNALALERSTGFEHCSSCLARIPYHLASCASMRGLG